MKETISDFIECPECKNTVFTLRHCANQTTHKIEHALQCTECDKVVFEYDFAANAQKTQ